jgi:sialidase-1
MAKTIFRYNGSIRALRLVLLTAYTAFAHVNNPAKNEEPYHKGFTLFRSFNMRSTDKLPDAVSFYSFRIPAVVATTTRRILAFAECQPHNT